MVHIHVYRIGYCVRLRAVSRSEGRGARHKRTCQAVALAASLATSRKLGCSIFVVWEDLVDVRPKMVLSFVATLMSFQHAQQTHLH